MKFATQSLFFKASAFFCYIFLLNNKFLYGKKEDKSPLRFMELFIEVKLSLCWGTAPSGWCVQLEIVLSHVRNQFHWLCSCPALYSIKSRRIPKVHSHRVSEEAGCHVGVALKTFCKDFK